MRHRNSEAVITLGEVAQKDYLLILGDREGLAWVVANERMAFPRHRAREVSRLAPGDRLWLYTSRGCFHSPNHDRGRIMGRALVSTPVRALETELVLGEKSYSLGCDIEIHALAPFRTGLEIGDIVERLGLLAPQARRAAKPFYAWSWILRRPLVAITPEAGRYLEAELTPRLVPVSSVRSEYVNAGRARSAPSAA